MTGARRQEEIRFGDRLVGSEHPPYVIAEIGANHGGDLDLARRMIDAAAAAGADAVKFQSYQEGSLCARVLYDESAAATNGDGETLRDRIRRCQLSAEDHRQLSAHCRESGIAFASTPFSPEEADLLDELAVPFLKVASMDVDHLPLLRHVAGKGRPIVLSTGMATLGEVGRAVETLSAAGADELVLLHCVSLYPPRPEQANLRRLEALSAAFGRPVGYSDHTVGPHVAIASVALGACVVETHFTLDKALPGSDHAISADPAELATLVAGARDVWSALRAPGREVAPEERAKTAVMRRSIVARGALPAGRVLDREDLDYKRPGRGIPPDRAEAVIGRRLVRPVAADALLAWSDLEGGEP